MRLTRHAALLALGSVVLPLSGCDILSELFSCDPETDAQCVDPERGSLAGTLDVTRAEGAASAGATNTHGTGRYEDNRHLAKAPNSQTSRAADVLRQTIQNQNKNKSSTHIAAQTIQVAETPMVSVPHVPKIDLDAVESTASPYRNRKMQLPSVSSRNTPNGIGTRKEPRDVKFRAGELILRAADNATHDATHDATHKAVHDVRHNKQQWSQRLSRVLGESLHAKAEVTLCSTDFMCLVKMQHTDGKPLSLDETKQALHLVKTHREFQKDVKYAELNTILEMLRVPNDDFYTLQWHYAALDMEAAWDITIGDDDVVAAVIDTGIVTTHPDLEGRVTGGADLIDDASVANDGDGRDDDGFDVGDQACGGDCHSYHGSHVAGTMAASTDNASQVAGMAWKGQLLAVRVLGSGGGSLFDIASGILWSVGEDVDGVRRNANPADVLNMSLGGGGSSDVMNEAVEAATNTGAIVLVAAGNDNADAADFTPANAPNAITIASVGSTGPSRATPVKATYSNFGELVDVAAPGGEQREDVNQDGQGDGVLSTYDDFVVYYQGTSMATPHVAGLAMLLKSVNRNLNQEDVRTILRDTADSNIECPEGCGAGMINAARALLAVEGNLEGSKVVANPSFVRLGQNATKANVLFKNIGTSDAEVSFSASGPDREAISIGEDNINLGEGRSKTVSITIDRDSHPEGEAAVVAVTDSGDTVQTRLSWSDQSVLAVQTVFVGALRVEGDSFAVERIINANNLENFRFDLFNLPAGDYLVIGLADDDNDGVPEDGEGVGVFPSLENPELLTVSAGSDDNGIDFFVPFGFNQGEDDGDGDGRVGDACTRSADCQGGLFCETEIFPGGYCTAGCANGSSCPSGSACFCFGDVGNCDLQICLKTCDSDNDCRTDENYICDADQTCFPE